MLGRRNPQYRQRLSERFGHGPAPGDGQTIWLHAVSVGETQAAIPLVRALQERYPDHRMLITTVTPTGAEHVQRTFGDSVLHNYLPYDLPGCLNRFLNRVNPAVLLVMETELWPNLFHNCRQRNIPVAVINARLSDRSARRYGLLPGLTRHLLAQVAVIACRSDSDARRFRHLGAGDSQIFVTGNIKFDLELPEIDEEQLLQERHHLFGFRPVWIAASTHSGEEESVLAAHRLIRDVFPESLLVLAPRHPERCEDIDKLTEAGGFSWLRHSQSGNNIPVTEDIYLIDSLGELRDFLGRSDLVFMGGSLVDVGGHNLLEPAASGRAILTGPFTYNFEDIANELLTIGGALLVRTPQELARHVIMLLGDEAERVLMGKRAKQFVRQSRGSTGRVMSRIMPLIQG